MFQAVLFLRNDSRAVVRVITFGLFQIDVDIPSDLRVPRTKLRLETVLEIEIDGTKDERERGVRDGTASPGTNRYVQLEERLRRLESSRDDLRGTALAADDEAQ